MSLKTDSSIKVDSRFAAAGEVLRDEQGSKFWVLIEDWEDVSFLRQNIGCFRRFTTTTRKAM